MIQMTREAHGRNRERRGIGRKVATAQAPVREPRITAMAAPEIAVCNLVPALAIARQALVQVIMAAIQPTPEPARSIPLRTIQDRLRIIRTTTVTGKTRVTVARQRVVGPSSSTSTAMVYRSLTFPNRRSSLMQGDGLKHRSAWAGAGVLFVDADGDGKISDRREYVFTDWTPGAADDMEALRAAFDGSGDRKLTAADVRFSEFKGMVTGAGGTTSVRRVVRVGIGGIELRAEVRQVVVQVGAA